MSTSGREHLVEPQAAEPQAAHVRWRVARIEPRGQRALMAPYVDAGVLEAQLDAAYGVSGWGNRYRPFGADAVGCELDVGGVVKSAIARAPAAHADPAELAAAALTKAVAMHGLALPVDADAVAWVEYDVEEGEPLYWPEAGAAGAAESAGPVGPATGAGEATAPASGAEPARPPESAPDGAAPIKSEGQRAIDKLVDRLREAGHGLEAARLVMEHKGYGNDPDEARELYARLRQLLLEGRPS